MKKIKLATVFSGIGAVEQAFQKLGEEYEIVFACDNGERELPYSFEEINEMIKDMDSIEKNKYIKKLYDMTKKHNYVKDSYFANYDIDENRWYEDIRFIDGNQFKNEVDVLVGGSPCQSFSIIGKRAGLNDARGTLFYDFARLINEIKPKAFIYENVLGMLSHDKGNTWKHIREIFESLGYKLSFTTLNSKDYGIPQDRKRLFVVGMINHNTNFTFEDKQELKTTMFDYLETTVDAKHYVGKKGFEFITNPKYKNRARLNQEIIQTQKANQQFNWNGDFVFEPLSHVVDNQEIMDRAFIGEYKGEKGVIRQLTYRECLRLMGFSDKFKIVVPNVPAYRQIGNSIVVNVLESIVKNILSELRSCEINSNKLRIATVFSGIGAIEQALKRMNIDHEIVFACDNGDIQIDYDLEKEKQHILSLNGPVEKKKYVDDLYLEKSGRTNFVKISYLANYDLDENYFFRDIRLLDGKDFRGKVDMLVGGSPCQSFSTVGFQGGLEDTRGTLFYDYANLIKDVNPKVFIYENVRGLTTHDGGKTWSIMKCVFDELGYNIYEDVLDAKDYGIPQTRRRLFVVGIRQDINLENGFIFPPKKEETKYTMHDFLLSNVKEGNFKSIDSKITLFPEKGIVDKKYILSPKLKEYVMKTGTKTFVQKVKIDLPIARTLLSTMGNRHRAGIDNYVTDLKNEEIIYKENPENIRMLSEREAHRLMGFPDDYKIVVSRAQGYKQAGNSIVVDVLIAIMKSIMDTKIFKEVQYDSKQNDN